MPDLKPASDDMPPPPRDPSLGQRLAEDPQTPRLMSHGHILELRRRLGVTRWAPNPGLALTIAGCGLGERGSGVLATPKSHGID
jgi:hypothetical protein